MGIIVELLLPTDEIRPTDWVRPLEIISMSGGHSDYYSFKNVYSGTPENNAKWVQVKCTIGKFWFGKTVGEYNRAMHNCGTQYEFLRGDIPYSHKLNMSGYTDLSTMEEHPDEFDDIPF